jgi:putative membrane protein
MQNPGSPYQGPYGGPYSGGYPQGAPRHRHRWLLIVLGACVVAILAVFLLVLLSPATFGYHPATGVGFGPFGLFGSLFVIFIFLLVLSLIVRIAMWSSRGRGYGYRQGYGGGRRYGAFAIARERYARGEITREQYDQIMQDLQRRPGYPPSP